MPAVTGILLAVAGISSGHGLRRPASPQRPDKIRPTVDRTALSTAASQRRSTGRRPARAVLEPYTRIGPGRRADVCPADDGTVAKQSPCIVRHPQDETTRDRRFPSAGDRPAPIKSVHRSRRRCRRDCSAGELRAVHARSHARDIKNEKMTEEKTLTEEANSDAEDVK
jgi:hypothetical protein